MSGPHTLAWPIVLVVTLAPGLPAGASAVARALAQQAPETAATDTTGRDALAVSLYVGFGVLQGLDVHSTLTAVERGGREANPVMRALQGQPAGLVAVKAGATVGVVWAAEKLRRRNRIAALVLMGALNSAYAVVVASNYRAARRP
jgi:hypothetical protein